MLEKAHAPEDVKRSSVIYFRCADIVLTVCELEARGVQLDYRVFVPKPVPDGQNFAATPFVRSWFLKENRDGKMFDADDYGRTFRRVSDPQNKDWGRHPFLDLVAWKMAFAAIRSGATNLHLIFFTTNRADLETRARAAPAVLEGLKTSEASLAELRAASQLHYSRYPVDYDLENPWGILLPHFALANSGCIGCYRDASRYYDNH